MVAVAVRLAAVLDLTEGAVRRSLGVSATRMRNDDWRAKNRRGVESRNELSNKTLRGNALLKRRG